MLNLKTDVPRHVGIVLDGNRRLAKKLLQKPWKGHEYGVKKAREVLSWAHELGIKYVTAYVLSIENFKTRPRRELRYILRYFEDEMDSVLSGKHVVHSTRTKVRFLGRLFLLPKSLLEKMLRVEKLTKNYKKHVLNIAIAYGGQQEITDAVIKIAKKISDGILKPCEINEKLIKHSLYTNGTPYPDLIIRTGSEKRLSNFLLWQSAYSELFFLDTCWPELTKQEFVSVIKEYQQRERRFGK